MATATGGLLAAEVFKAGGYGFLNPKEHKPSLAGLTTQLDIAAKTLNFSTSERLPIGTGFLVWRLEEMELKAAEEIVDLACRRSSAIWLSFGKDLEPWVQAVRQRTSEGLPKIFIVASDENEAIRAAGWGVEAIIVQGIEAGGHGASSGSPIISLLPSVIQKLSSHSKPPLILAAGGITTGEQIAAFLTMGAQGVVIGTGFLATPEALYGPAQKEALVQADSAGATIRTELYDILRGTPDWPKGIDGRALINKSFTEYQEGKSTEELKEAYAKAVKEQDASRIVTWSGKLFTFAFLVLLDKKAEQEPL